MIARFRKDDKVRWNALALHGDDRNGWTVEGLDEAKGLFPIYKVRKGKQGGSAVQSDLEPCPTHARLQREAQTSGAIADLDLIARLRAVTANSLICREAADDIERLERERHEAQERFEELRDVVYNEANADRERLRSVAKRIIESAQSTVASANSVLVHRQLIGELRELLAE